MRPNLRVSRGDGQRLIFQRTGMNWAGGGDVVDDISDRVGTNGFVTRRVYSSLGTNELESFDSLGRFVSVTAASGALHDLTYDSMGRLTNVRDSFGRQLNFTYNSASRVATMRDPAGGTYLYSYDSAGRLASVTYPDSSSRSFIYNESAYTSSTNLMNALTGIVDESAIRFATYSYDAVGRAIRSEHHGGVQKFRLTFGANQTSVLDPLGTSRVYGFTSLHNVFRPTAYSQPAGAGCGPSSSAITYDAQANVASRTDFNNHKVCYAYDLSRNLETKRVEGVFSVCQLHDSLNSPPAGARLISAQWHPDWRLETKIAEPKKLTTITYNGQGATCAPSTVLVDGKPPAVICTRTEQATTDETGAAGFAATVTGTARTWRYTYTTYGRVLTATDPNNRTTTTSYHPDNDADLGKRGNVASITNAANHTTYITDYNPHGQPTRIVDPNGVVTVLTYDPRMRLTGRTVGNEATVFGYDPVGQMTSVNLPDGARLTYSYDAAHRLTAINDHKGNRIDYTLDAMGNRITEKTKDPGGVLVGNIARVIDALNRVQQVTGAGQ